MFVLAVLAAATLYGLWKGVAWQVASIASLAISTWVAGHYGARLAPYLSNQAPWNRFLAMLILYLVTSAGIWMLFRLVSQVIDRIHLKDFDRQLGAILGFAKGLLLCVVMTFFAVTLSESARQSILHSPSGYYMAKLIRNAGPLLPREARDVLGKYVDELNRKLDPATPPEKSLGGRLQDRLPGELPGPLREPLRQGIEQTFSGLDHSWQGGPQQPPSAQTPQPSPWAGASNPGPPAPPAPAAPTSRPPPWNP
jgi:membrane protein required for colicin V production